MNQQAERILANNLFMTLSTVNAKGQPWSTPVFYALDEKYNFYWYSRKDTRHSQNIQENNKVSASIFSLEGEDKMVGLYVEETAQELSEEELVHATKIYAEKGAADAENHAEITTNEDFLGDALLRMYKLTPEKIYISGEPTKWKGKWMDTRVEVSLL